MGVLEQFQRTGEIGDELAVLTYRVVRAVARLYNYPHPKGRSWSDESAVWSAVGLFFAEGDGQRHLAVLCGQATNDAHLWSLLETTVRRWFQTLGRKTARGRLVRALKRVMGEEEAFVEVEPGKFWALHDGAPEPTTVALDELVAAAWSVDIEIIRASPEADQNSPWADREDQVAVLTAVLDAAGGAVHMNDIAQVIHARVGLLDPPLEVGLDSADDPALGVVDADLDTSGASDQAREIFAQLGDRERVALAYWDETVRDAAEETGIPRSSFQDARTRVRAALRDRLERDDDPVLRRLLRLCQQHAAARTGTGGLASTPEVEGQGEGDE